MRLGFNRNYANYTKHLINEIKNGRFKSKVQEWIHCPEGIPYCTNNWASESAKIACDAGYDGVDVNPDLGEEYYDRAKDVIDEQYAKAGVRMSAVLNWALSSDLLL